jgi:hypothetical protein
MSLKSGEKSMRDTPFIGRATEMERLKGLLSKKSARACRQLSQITKAVK